MTKRKSAAVKTIAPAAAGTPTDAAKNDPKVHHSSNAYGMSDILLIWTAKAATVGYFIKYTEDAPHHSPARRKGDGFFTDLAAGGKEIKHVLYFMPVKDMSLPDEKTPESNQ